MTLHVEALGTDAEVLGGAIHGFIHAINRERIERHLEKLGMTEIDPNKWYPKQMYVDLWNEILSSSDSAMFDLIDAGMTIARGAWPPEADELPFEEIVRTWGDAFDAVNRGADRGYVRAEQIADQHWILHLRTPDPDDINYGVVYGACKRFLPAGTLFTVWYDEKNRRRDEGGKETIIHLSWE